MRIATGSTKKRGQKERTQCPQCHAVYMQGAYILVQENKKMHWKKIGLSCSACGHFIPEGQARKKPPVLGDNYI